MEPSRESDPGARLVACERGLRLLLAHLAGRAVRARVELDDLVQEVYLRALARPEALPPAEPVADGQDGPRGTAGDANPAPDPALQRYLRRIARNAVVDVARAIRRAKRDGNERPLERSSWSRSGPAAGLATASPGPATRAGSNEEVARILASFEGLSPEHRRVIGLRQLEALSARETARRMGRSESAVHSLYRRALAAWGAAASPPSTPPSTVADAEHHESRESRDESEEARRPGGA